MIIAHESVLRVLYGYLMACDTMSIPKLKFPRNHIIEIVPASYQNLAKKIIIPGVDSLTAPNSPEEYRLPAGTMPSGVVSPMVQLDPAMGKGMSSLSLGPSSLGVGGSSTPLPRSGAITPIVLNEPAEIDETNPVGKEVDF